MVADGAHLDIDARQMAADEDKIVRQYLSAGTRAVALTAKQLERKLEIATQAAVPGKLWRAWGSRAYPKNGQPARDPVGEVFVNGKSRTRGAIKFWTEPGAIRGRSEQYLAIPLPAAGPRGRGRDLTPGEWERAHGVELRFVYRANRPSLLVADGGVLNGRTGTFRQATGKRAAADAAAGRGVRHQATVPIFVLVRMVKHRNAFSIQPLVAGSRADLVPNFITEVVERARG